MSVEFLHADATKLPILSGYGDLIYCDPPTNRGMNEGGQCDTLRWDDYLTFCKEWISEASRLASHDSYFIVCCYPQLRYYLEDLIYKYTNFDWSHEIIWSYSFGIYTRKRFVSSHDNVLVFKRGNPPFNWDKVAVESQRLHSGDDRGDQRGRTPGSVWNIARVPGNSKARWYIIDTYKRSSQPVELCERLLLAFTNKDNLVIDMFCGTGSMSYACSIHQRRCISVDICKHYLEEAENRLKGEATRLLVKGFK